MFFAFLLFVLSSRFYSIGNSCIDLKYILNSANDEVEFKSVKRSHWPSLIYGIASNDPL